MDKTYLTLKIKGLHVKPNKIRLIIIVAPTFNLPIVIYLFLYEIWSNTKIKGDVTIFIGFYIRGGVGDE
jgi:hypothetical protein